MSMNPFYFDAPIILNNDGKIPLCAGIPFPKLGTYVKTIPKSNWSGYIG